MARKNLPTRFLRNMQIGDYIIQSLYNNVINQDSQKIGWQTLSLLIMSKSFEKRVCLTAFAESEFGNPFQCYVWVVPFLTPYFVKIGTR